MAEKRWFVFLCEEEAEKLKQSQKHTFLWKFAWLFSFSKNVSALAMTRFNKAQKWSVSNCQSKSWQKSDYITNCCINALHVMTQKFLLSHGASCRHRTSLGHKVCVRSLAEFLVQTHSWFWYKHIFNIRWSRGFKPTVVKLNKTFSFFYLFLYSKSVLSRFDMPLSDIFRHAFHLTTQMSKLMLIIFLHCVHRSRRIIQSIPKEAEFFKLK